MVANKRRERRVRFGFGTTREVRPSRSAVARSLMSEAEGSGEPCLEWGDSCVAWEAMLRMLRGLTGLI